MKRNMGATDRVIRTVLALTVGILYATGVIGGAVALGLGLLAGVLVLTSLVGWCPAYTLLGISTRPESRTART